MKTTLAFLVLSVFAFSILGCSGESSGGDNLPVDSAPKAGSAEDPAKMGKAGGGSSAPALPPPPLGDGK